jgi:hypothetical protein
MNYFNSIDGRKVVNPNLPTITQVQDIGRSDWEQVFTELGFVFRKEKPEVAKIYQHKHDKELALVLWLACSNNGNNYNITAARGASKDTLQKTHIRGPIEDNLVSTLNNLLSKIRGLYETNN